MKKFAEFDENEETTLPDIWTPVKPSDRVDALEITVVDTDVIHSEFDGNPTVKLCVMCLHESEGCVCVK